MKETRADFVSGIKLALLRDWVAAEAKTVRFLVLNVPSKLVYHARELMLKIGCSAEFFRFFRASRKRCQSLVLQFGDVSAKHGLQ